MTCTFFGHREAPQKIEPILKSTLIHLIENEDISSFYVGNNGNFDRMVIGILKHLKEKYTHIRYSIVLAYIPKKETEENYDLTVYPEAIETVPPKYAISERNRWMISKSDYAVTYVNSPGNSLKFLELARKNGLVVINIAEKEEMKL